MPKGLLQKYSQVFPAGHHSRLAAAILKKRRADHLKKLTGPCFFSGVPREPGSENIWIMNGLKIFQEPALMFLTGINQPEIILALNPLAPKKDREILFVPPKNPAREFWDGVRFGWVEGKEDINRACLSDIQDLTGIQNIQPLKNFSSHFSQQISRDRPRQIFCFYHEYFETGKKNKVKRITTDHNWAFKNRLIGLLGKIPAQKRPGLKSIARDHFAWRLPLDSYQIKDVSRAVRHTHEAFMDTLRHLKKFSTENEIAAYLEYKMKFQSPFGLSFPSIVASGKNATVLHYLKNDEKISPKGLILLDFGVRWGTMHADISRTIPAGGKFNPMQKILYGIVLDALKLNQKNAIIGSTIRELNFKVWNFIESQLEKRFLAHGGKAKRSYSGQPHGVSHLMGEQEHDGDPFRLYQDTPLQENWQISNEPGLYGHFSIQLNGKKYSEYIGIRIEDNLLISRGKAKCLSQRIPREINELEAAIGRAE